MVFYIKKTDNAVTINATVLSVSYEERCMQ